MPQLCTVLTDSLKTPLYIVETVETSIFSKSFLRSAKRSSERAGVKCEVRGASLLGGKMRGTERGINAKRWVICEAQQTTGAAGVVVGCETLKRN